MSVLCTSEPLLTNKTSHPDGFYYAFQLDHFVQPPIPYWNDNEAITEKGWYDASKSSRKNSSLTHTWHSALQDI
jgi:hypothetical protein